MLVLRIMDCSAVRVRHRSRRARGSPWSLRRSSGPTSARKRGSGAERRHNPGARECSLPLPQEGRSPAASIIVAVVVEVAGSLNLEQGPPLASTPRLIPHR